jgi:hypothetical protein
MANLVKINFPGIDPTRVSKIKKEIGTHISKYQTEIDKYLTDCLTPVELSKVSVNITITISNK